MRGSRAPLPPDTIAQASSKRSASRIRRRQAPGAEVPAELPGIVHGGCSSPLGTPRPSCSAGYGLSPHRRTPCLRRHLEVPHSSFRWIAATAPSASRSCTTATPWTSGSVAEMTGAGDGARVEWRRRAPFSPAMSRLLPACGSRQPSRPTVALSFDDEGVPGRGDSARAWRMGGDRIHPAAPVLLDRRVAWWLGALVMKEAA